ncbi:MAG: hypothetical protein ACYC9N_11635, partial [Thermoanaerobaculia bacterium]
MLAGTDFEKAVSYTRFVLPFAYSPQRLRHVHDGKSYQLAKLENEEARRRYFTPETANVLFRRAAWFQSTAQAHEEDFWVNGSKLTVNFSPPRLVLFESERAFKTSARNEPVVTHTGFLIIDATFPSQTDVVPMSHVLYFNEEFRYWRRPYNEHFNEHFGPFIAAAAEGNETNIRMRYFRRWSDYLNLPIEYSGRWYQLFPSSGRRSWPDEAESWVKNDPGSGDSGWIAYTDERAFVYTCAIGAEGMEMLPPSGSGPADFPYWVSLLNVDRTGSHPSPFEREWVQQRTYTRWEHYGTLYGFNTHACAMFTPLPDPTVKNPIKVWKHFREVYFDQILLLLYVRVTTFRFSDLLSRVSEKIPINGHHFRSLREEFARFTNLYRFPLLSSQQQGVEMYTKARKHLDIDELFEEVQKEIEATHEFFELRESSAQSKVATWLTMIATVAVLPALLLSWVDTESYRALKEAVRAYFQLSSVVADIA